MKSFKEIFEEQLNNQIKSAWNSYIDKGGTTLSKIPNSFITIKGSQNIKTKELMEEKLCYFNSLVKANENGFDLYVGFHLDKNVVKRLLGAKPEFINGSFHAWNVKNKKVYDFTLGKNKGIYIGQKISSKKLKNGKDVRNILFILLKI